MIDEHFITKMHVKTKLVEAGFKRINLDDNLYCKGNAFVSLYRDSWDYAVSDSIFQEGSYSMNGLSELYVLAHGNNDSE